MPIDGKSVNLSVQVSCATGVHSWCMSNLLFVYDGVLCAWVPGIAYQGLCTPSSEAILTPTVNCIQLKALAGFHRSS